MDLVDWSQSVFEKIRTDYNAFVARLGFVDIHFIPMSALKGDSVVDKSDRMPWYNGPTFLHHIEQVNIASDRNLVDMRFPVQYVLRPNLDFRGFAGTVASGVLRVGDEVSSLPSRQISRVESIVTADGNLQEAFPPMAVTVTLEDKIDVSRGDMLVHVNNVPHMGNELEAMLLWMSSTPSRIGGTYQIKQCTSVVPGALTKLRYKIDVNTMRKVAGAEDAALELNEIGRARITLHRPIAFDPYAKNRNTGSFVVVNRMTNATVAAGMIIDRAVSRRGHDRKPVSDNIVRSESLVAAADREKLLGQKGATVWLTGLSGSGKSTVARKLEKALMDAGRLCCILDGDNIRHGLNRDLGFSMEDRTENIRRVAEVAHLMNTAGVIVITAFISPYVADRRSARAVVGDERFVEVFVDAPIEVCEQRDPKGLYKKARAGEVFQFTGVSAPYEPPEEAELTLPTAEISADDAVQMIIDDLRGRHIIR